MGNLLVHGGTHLSGEVVRDLLDAGVEPIVTVTRKSARDLYPEAMNGRIRVGRLTPSALRTLIEEESVSAILDVTHPFADRISLEAINAADERDLPYLYLDRDPVLPEEHELLTVASGWLDAAQSIGGSGNVLLTIGIKRLEFFTANLDRDRLVVRVLPDESSLSVAKQAGVERKNIIAMWPPDTADLEAGLLRDFNIETLVTKDSGPSGNLPEKWEACRETGTELVAVERPEVDHPNRTLKIDRAVEWGIEHAGS